MHRSCIVLTVCEDGSLEHESCFPAHCFALDELVEGRYAGRCWDGVVAVIHGYAWWWDRWLEVRSRLLDVEHVGVSNGIALVFLFAVEGGGMIDR